MNGTGGLEMGKRKRKVDSERVLGLIVQKCKEEGRMDLIPCGFGLKKEDVNKDVYVEIMEKGSKKGKDKKGIEVFPNTIEDMKKELECARKVIEEYEKSQLKLKKQKAKIENSFVEMCNKINALMTKYTTKHRL